MAVYDHLKLQGLHSPCNLNEEFVKKFNLHYEIRVSRSTYVINS